MRRLESLCRRYNRHHDVQICVIKHGRCSYSLRSWIKSTSRFGFYSMHFSSLSDCTSYVQSLFRG